MTLEELENLCADYLLNIYDASGECVAELHKTCVEDSKDKDDKTYYLCAEYDRYQDRIFCFREKDLENAVWSNDQLRINAEFLGNYGKDGDCCISFYNFAKWAPKTNSKSFFPD